MLCTFSSNLNISNLFLGFDTPLWTIGSLLVVRTPRCSLLQLQTSLSLTLSTSTCIQEMWRVVADLKDRHTNLRHLSMHKSVGRSISRTGNGTQMYHHSSYSESKFCRKLYKNGYTTHTNALEMRAKHASNSNKCTARLIATGTRHNYAALAWSCTKFVHTVRTTHARHAQRPQIPFPMVEICPWNSRFCCMSQG